MAIAVFLHLIQQVVGKRGFASLLGQGDRGHIVSSRHALIALGRYNALRG